MTRDEILAEIEAVSTEPEIGAPSLATISVRMSHVVELSRQYPDHADSESLAGALESALDRFAAMVEQHAL